MPDPADPTPVKATKRGGKTVVVDRNGKPLPDAAFSSAEAAEELVGRVNATWERAKSERKRKGAPAITETRLLQEMGVGSVIAAQQAMDAASAWERRRKDLDPPTLPPGKHGAAAWGTFNPSKHPRSRVGEFAKTLHMAPGGRFDLPSGVSVEAAPRHYIVRDRAGGERKIKAGLFGDRHSAAKKAAALALRMHETGKNLSEALEEAGFGYAVGKGLSSPSTIKFNPSKHPRSRVGEFAASLKLSGPDDVHELPSGIKVKQKVFGYHVVDRAGAKKRVHGPRAAEKAAALALRMHETGKNLKEADVATDFPRLEAALARLEEAIFKEAEHPRARGGDFVSKTLKIGRVIGHGSRGGKSSFGSNLHRITLDGPTGSASHLSFDRRPSGQWHHTWTNTYGNVTSANQPLTPEQSSLLDKLDAKAAQEDIAALTKMKRHDDAKRLKAHVEGGYFTGPSAGKKK